MKRSSVEISIIGKQSGNHSSHLENKTLEDYSILYSGIDRLYLNVFLKRKFNNKLFHCLQEFEEKSMESHKVVLGYLNISDGSKDSKFLIDTPFDTFFTKSNIWVLSCKEYNLEIRDSLGSELRPGVSVTVQPETFWKMSARDAANWILYVIKGIGAEIKSVNTTDVALCMDILVPSSMWNRDIRRFAVTKEPNILPKYCPKIFDGVHIGKHGKDDIRVHIYDMYYESIHSPLYTQYTWLFDAWKLDEVPAGKTIIRVEFHLKTEALKSLGINSITDFCERESEVWHYLTTEFLSFKDKPKNKHTERETLEWWTHVQEGYKGSQQANTTNAIKHHVMK